MPPSLTLVENPTAQQVEAIACGLTSYNVGFTGEGERESRQFAVMATDDAGAVCGGILAQFHWGWCYLDMLWVREDCRGGGLGHRLLEAAENKSRTMGIRNVYLWTASFQAPEFYMKHGYAVFGQLEDCPPGHTKFYLRKTLA